MSAKTTNNPFLYLAVFISGMVTLAVELSASRLLGNVFGTSNIVWANVIGLILLYLTIGYFIGGRWADRSPYPRTFYSIMIWAAFLSALIPLVSRPVLSLAAEAVVGAEAALAIGSFVSILVLFSIPVTLLGCVSPFAIRLAIVNPADAGKIAGQIYAISTLGSLVGTFVPVLFLIPELGTFRTFILFSALLYLIGFIGLWRAEGMQRALRWIWMPIMIFLLSLWSLNGPLRSPLDDAVLLYDDESAYNYIQVQEDANGYRYLYLNEGQGVHSIWHPEQVGFGGTWDYFLAAPYFNNPPYTPDDVERLLVIGLAAGTIPRQYIDVYGNIPIDGVEIDSGIIDAAAQYFDMNAEMMPSLNVYAQDGRYILNQLDARYSVVAVDAYRPPYIPWHLTTVEFFQEIRDHLLPNGVVAINVGRTSTDRRLVDAMARTLSEVFPSLYAIDVPRSFNTLLIATMQPTEASNLTANLNNLAEDAHPLLSQVLQTSTNRLVPVTLADVVFIDDRAPVETLVDSLVLNFLLYGDVDEIR
ncbi:MAG: fused MFS/spermidine synthase [Anaerolineae bacterium]